MQEGGKWDEAKGQNDNNKKNVNVCIYSLSLL